MLTTSVKLLRCSVRCSSDTETEKYTDAHKNVSPPLSKPPLLLRPFLIGEFACAAAAYEQDYSAEGGV